LLIVERPSCESAHSSNTFGFASSEFHLVFVLSQISTKRRMVSGREGAQGGPALPTCAMRQARLGVDSLCFPSAW
jgi:hypothetical protein